MLSTLTTTIAPATSTWQSLTEEARDLLAYCLSKENPQLSVLASDAAGGELIAGGWVIQRPNPVPGIRTLEILPEAWKSLQGQRSELLTVTVLEKIQAKRSCSAGGYARFW